MDPSAIATTKNLRNLDKLLQILNLCANFCEKNTLILDEVVTICQGIELAIMEGVRRFFLSILKILNLK